MKKGLFTRVEKAMIPVLVVGIFLMQSVSVSALEIFFEEDQSDKGTNWYGYINDFLIPEYGLADMETKELYYNTPPRADVSGLQEGCGIVGADFVDMTDDGKDDLVLYHTAYTWGNGGDYYGLVASLYTENGGTYNHEGDLWITDFGDVMGSGVSGIGYEHFQVGIVELDGSHYIWSEGNVNAYHADYTGFRVNLCGWIDNQFRMMFINGKTDGGSSGIAYSLKILNSDGTDEKIVEWADEEYWYYENDPSVIDASFDGCKNGADAIVEGYRELGFPEDPDISLYEQSYWALGCGEEYFPTYWSSDVVKRSVEFGTAGDRGNTLQFSISDYTGLLEKLNQEEQTDEVVWDYSITEEKGKTILHVVPASDVPEGKIYTINIFTNGNSITSEKSVYKVLSPENGYVQEYDFSTDLQLPSGNYTFLVGEAFQAITHSSDDGISYDYSETFKIAEDDPYGNEREYRRLLSEAIDSGDNPILNTGILENISARFRNFGMDVKQIEGVFSVLEEAPEPYLNLFLLTFYKYAFVDDDRFAFTTESEFVVDYDEEWDNEKVIEFFHEVGHAVENKRTMGIMENGTTFFYIGNSKQMISFMDNIEKDFEKKISELLTVWEDEFDGPLLTDEEREAYIKDIMKELFGPKRVKRDSSYVIKRPDNTELEEQELDAYYYILQLLDKEFTDRSNDVKGFANTWKTENDMGLLTSANMVYDSFPGWTNNKVFRHHINWLGTEQNLFGHGYPVDKDEYYWFQENGVINYKLLDEPFAEYFACMICKQTETDLLNRTYFSNLCQYFDQVSFELEDKYKNLL